MKLISLIIVSLMFLFVIVISSCVPAKQPQLFDGDWHNLSIYESGLVKSEIPMLTRLQDATVYHIDIGIAADLLTITGREQVHYTNLETVPLEDICFQLFPNVSGSKTSISSVLLENNAVEFKLESDGSTLCLALPETLKPQNALTVQIDFTVEIPQSLSGNYGLFGYSGDILALDCFYPVIPVHDESGWHTGAGAPFGDKTFFDASFYMVRVTAPKNLVLVASGSKVESKTKDDSQTVTFAAGPARDFYLVASRRFTVTSTVVGETTINNYFFPEMVGVNLAASAAEDSLNSFSVRLGEYPYKELDIVPLHLQGNALGIEYPGIFGVNIETYSRQDFLQSTVAHETAHQWFYNMIGNDQVNEPWLDEALSQYMTSLYFLDRYGENGRQSYRQSWIRSWNKVNNQSIPIGLPVSEYLPNEYSSIVYGRGPLFMEALAEKIGQKTFDSCLRQYCISNRWQIVNATSFQSHFEHCSSSEISELFQNWVYSK